MRGPWTTPPPFESSAPKRSAFIRASDTAAAHIAHGSSVTHKVHSSRRDVPSLSAAARIASKGLGETAPLYNPETSDTEKAANRRVEIRLLPYAG